MLHFEVSWLAVVLATVIAWAFGAAWYMAFAKQWVASIGKKMEDIDRSDYTPYLWSVLCIAIMAYAVAVLTPALMGTVTAASGALVGAQAIDHPGPTPRRRHGHRLGRVRRRALGRPRVLSRGPHGVCVKRCGTEHSASGWTRGALLRWGP